MICDLCERKIKRSPALLTMSKKSEGALTADYYNFWLCHSCARSLFGWIGEKMPEVTGGLIMEPIRLGKGRKNKEG